jgi:transcriptional regulator with XRE-family HTH domain
MVGLSTRQLDERADLSPGYVWRLEAGQRTNVSASTAERLAFALGVSVGWLLTGESTGPSRAA